MDKELRKEKIELEEELLQLNTFIHQVDNFMNEKAKYYQHEESIQVLEKMKSILSTKKKEYKELSQKTLKMQFKLENTCSHEIVIDDPHNSCCALCGKIIIDVPETTKLRIKLPTSIRYFNQPGLFYLRHGCDHLQNRVFEAIENGIESGHLLSYVEESLEKLQCDNHIKVRRLK